MNDDLIGKEIKGFKFDANPYIYYQATAMDKFIDKVGKIVKYNEIGQTVDVNFGGFNTWSYPLAEVLKQLKEQEKELSDQDIKELFDKIQTL